MRKIVTTFMAAVAFLAMCCLTGCGDPEKSAGPGGERMQPYDSSSGQYK